MRAILARKRLTANNVRKIMDQSLQAAAAHRLECARSDFFVENLEQQRKDFQRLLRQLRGLLRTISCLPPRSKGELNKIIYAVDWGAFDTEVFSDVMRDILGALSTIPPVRIAKKAGAARVEGAPRAGRPKTDWRDEPGIVARWEGIPPQTRAPVEEKVRDWRPPKRSGTCSFLDHLIGLLEQHRPIVKKRRRPFIQRRYLRNIAEIWRHFGLRVGLAYDGMNERSIDSHFQRFARLALRSAGNETSKVSADQIRKIKRLTKVKGSQQRPARQRSTLPKPL
jgi:hypothetical protein